MKEFAILLRNRNFVYLWLSQIISQAAVNTLSFLILIRLFEKTGSTIASSFVWVAYALPAIIVGPIGAVSSDIVDKRKILMLSTSLQAIIVLTLAVFHARFLYFSYMAVFLYSVLNQFYVPAEASSLPNLVAKKQLPQANSLFFLTVQSGFAIGFIFAGLFYETIGFGAALLVAALSLVGAFISASFLPQLKPLEHIPTGFEKGVGRFFSELALGYRFIKNNKTILYPFALMVGLQVTLSILVISIPVLATQIVKIKPGFSGIVIGTPAVIGALTGVVLIPRLLSREVRKRKVIGVSLFILSSAILVLSSLVPALPFWLGRSMAILCFFLAGASYVGGLIPTLTYLQEVTPRDLLGRVFGNIWLVTTVATVLPVLFSATITEIFGINLMLDILGIVGMGVLFLIKLQNSSLFREHITRFIK